MSFTRTPLGLQNMAIFLSVDVVMFLEGGSKSYTLTEVLNNSVNYNTLDIKFWEILALHYAPNTEFKFRSIGSKTVLLELHQKILDNNIKNVRVGIDADYDILTNEVSVSTKLATTFGYSWENDIWVHDVLAKTLLMLSSLSRKDSGVIKADREVQNSRNSGMKLGVKEELRLYEYNLFVFDRKKWLRHITKEKNNPTPIINQLSIQKRIIIANEKITTIPKIRTVPIVFDEDLPRFHFGHLVADFMYKGIIGWLKQLDCNSTISKEAVFSIAIEAFEIKILSNNGHPITIHYRTEFERLGLS